ncbi:hypothetical protein ACF0H5_009359 [Mactra antiquata]
MKASVFLGFLFVTVNAQMYHRPGMSPGYDCNRICAMFPGPTVCSVNNKQYPSECHLDCEWNEKECDGPCPCPLENYHPYFMQQAYGPLTRQSLVAPEPSTSYGVVAPKPPSPVPVPQPTPNNSPVSAHHGKGYNPPSLTSSVGKATASYKTPSQPTAYQYPSAAGSGHPPAYGSTSSNNGYKQPSPVPASPVGYNAPNTQNAAVGSSGGAGGGRPMYGPFGCWCEPIWQPVCSRDNENYMNKCEAECEGKFVAYTGRCMWS